MQKRLPEDLNENEPDSFAVRSSDNPACRRHHRIRKTLAGRFAPAVNAGDRASWIGTGALSVGHEGRSGRRLPGRAGALVPYVLGKNDFADGLSY